MRNICIFNGDMSRGGGTERMTQVLANLLAENKEYSVSVLSLNNRSGNSYFLLDCRVIHSVLPGGNILQKIFSLASFLKKREIDVLINVDVMLGIYSLPMRVLNPRTKIIAWEMFNIRNDIGSKHTSMIRQISLYLASYYICLTKADMNAFQNEMKVRCPITYIYNPIAYDDSYRDYDMDSKTIITVGHFFHTKGFDLAVETARYVFQRHPDWNWKFFGDGTDMDQVKKLVEKYGLEKNILFCGRTADILNEYKRGSLYVMTSRTEGFGLVLTEAKSCNLPTLAFDVEFGPGEIIQDGVSGYLVEPFDCKAMADKICCLIENAELRKRFSVHAKDNLMNFSTDNFARAWEIILDEICE